VRDGVLPHPNVEEHDVRMAHAVRSSSSGGDGAERTSAAEAVILIEAFMQS